MTKKTPNGLKYQNGHEIPKIPKFPIPRTSNNIEKINKIWDFYYVNIPSGNPGQHRMMNTACMFFRINKFEYIYYFDIHIFFYIQMPKAIFLRTFYNRFQVTIFPSHLVARVGTSQASKVACYRARTSAARWHISKPKILIWIQFWRELQRKLLVYVFNSH
jgi:hypothetical protein